MKIIHAPTDLEPFVVLKKPSNIASAPLKQDDEQNVLEYAIKLFPEIKNVQGKKAIEYGLVHRLDTQTEGLLLIATTQNFFDYIQEEQKKSRFIKKYRAECDVFKENSTVLGGFPVIDALDFSVKKEFTISSRFRNFTQNKISQVRPVTENSLKSALKKCKSKKIYETKVKICGTKDEEKKSVLVECEITQGFRHQVRCHLAWLGLPVIGDKLYNVKEIAKFENNENQDKKMMFFATELQFEYPKGVLRVFKI